mgnify:CR=1 FL=1
MMNWKKLVAVLMVGLLVTACSRVPAGNVGVKVYLYGGDKGVDTEVLTPGRYWIGWNEELHLFPTFTQTVTWSEQESISFQTREGLSVNADVGLSYSVNPDSISLIFQKYRKGISEITDLYLRNMIRDALVDAASRLTIETVYGEGKGELIKKAEEVVRKQVTPLGINIERIYWVGDIRLPETIRAALNAKMEAQQKAMQRQNEIIRAQADAQIKIEEAKGVAESIRLQAISQAEANRILTESLNSDLIAYNAIQKWDGILPKITGNGAIPMLQLDLDKQ